MKIPFLTAKNRAIDIVFLLGLNVFCHRDWLRPGIIECGDWSWYPKEFLMGLLDFPFCWTSRFFSGPLFMIHGWPLQWMAGLIAHLGFDFGVAERLIYFFPYLIISVAGIYYFTYLLFKKRLICFFSALFFIFNIPTVQLLLYNRLVAYALMPLTLGFFLKGKRDVLDKAADFNRSALSSYLLCGLLLTLTASYELRVAYLTASIIFLFFAQDIIRILADRDKRSLESLAGPCVYLGVISAVPFILNFYWIYPSLMSKAGYMLSGYDLSGWVKALSYFKLNHSLSVYLPSWPRGPQPGLIYYIIPLLVFMAIVFRPKDTNVRILSFLAVISIFLAKGANFPLGEIYIWMFKHLPGFNAFRDPGRFYMLICLAYSPLLGVSIDRISLWLGKADFRRLGVHIQKGYQQSTFLFLMFFIILYLIWPVMRGKIGKEASSHSMPKAYKTIEEFITAQPDSFRTFWRPYQGRFSFYSRKYPLVRGHYSPLSTYYFLSDIWNPKLFKDTQYITKILGLLNVKYCFLPQEEENLLGIDRDFCVSTFDKQQGLKKIDIGKGIDIYENECFYPRFFLAPNAGLIVGGRKSLFELASLETIDFSEWVFYFADEFKGDNIDLLNKVEMVVFNEREADGLILASITDEYRFDLAQYAISSDSPIPYKWKRVDVFPAGKYSSAYGEIIQNKAGAVYGNPAFPCELTTPIEIDVKESGNYEIWLRAATGPDTGKLSILKSKVPKNYSDMCGDDFQNYDSAISNEGILKNEDLKDNNPRFKWVKADSVYLNEGKIYFQIINKGGAGMLDQLVVIPSKVIHRLRKHIAGTLRSKNTAIVKIGNGFGDKGTIQNLFTSKDSMSVVWKQINPTKYEVRFKTEKPAYLIFSDIFDRRWTLNLDPPVKSISAYSLVNSFFIATPGEINTTLEFTPQRYVYKGLWVSGIGLVSICGYLVFAGISSFKKRKLGNIQNKLQ